MKTFRLLNFIFLSMFITPLFGQKSKSVVIKIIATTDLHGSFIPLDQIENKEQKSSLAQISTYVKQERAKKGQQVVLLDNGDILQGQPSVYYSNFEKKNQPHICAQVMNYMKYDAGSVGNHDIEAGHEVYDKLKTEFAHPWLAANAIDKKTGKSYFRPYHIIKRDNVKIAILGLMTPAIPKWLPEVLWKGLEFEDMVESARKWVKTIREKEKPDVIIGLCHAGHDFTYDKQDENTLRNENASLLVAQKVSGFDAIILGHDHDEVCKIVKNKDGKDVIFVDPSSYAKRVGVITIELTPDKKTGKFVKKAIGEIISTEALTPDAEYMRKFKPFFDEVQSYVDKPVGRFEKEATSQKAFFGNSEYVDFIHHVQLDLTQADISFAAPLSFSTTIKQGEIYVRDLFKLYKFENMLYVMKLSGQEIKDYLEFSAGIWFEQMKSENDHLLLFRKDAQGKLEYSKSGKPILANAFFNFESAYGIDYTIDVSKPIGSRVTIHKFSNGNAFDLNAEYKVAVNSYRGSGGGGHLTNGSKIPKEKLAERVISATDHDLRYYIMHWIEKKGSVTPPTANNWTIEPKEMYEKAKVKDWELLFGK
jgi:2',3'-cyclic-nucleotide 2'-phosphodiesterase / 3'-nucleotidase